MNLHLSSEHIAERLAGGGGFEAQRHEAACPDCRAELARMQTALEAFRRSVHAWTDREADIKIRSQSSLFAPHRPACPRLRWALASAVFALVVFIPMHKAAIDRQREAQAAEDALLLERVNDHLARRAPLAMEPLSELQSSSMISLQEDQGGLP